MVGPAALAAPAAPAAPAASASALLHGADGSEGGQQWLKRLVAQLSQVNRQEELCHRYVLSCTVSIDRSTTHFYKCQASHVIRISLPPYNSITSLPPPPTPPFYIQTCNQSDLHTALRVALTEPLEAEQAHLTGAAARASFPVPGLGAAGACEAAPEPPPAFVTPERLERLRRAIQRRGSDTAAAAAR